MSLDYNKKNIVLAKNLRKNSTPQEKRLWYDFLSTYEIKFQRQKAIGDFIVDFYCHKAKLVIELDGSQHYDPEEVRKDQIRTEYLKTQGVRVLRFTNLDIQRNFRIVCEQIHKACGEPEINF